MKKKSSHNTKSNPNEIYPCNMDTMDFDKQLNDALEEMNSLMRAFIPPHPTKEEDVKLIHSNHTSSVTLEENKYLYLSLRMSRKLEDQKIDLQKIDGIIDKVFKNYYPELFTISKILAYEAIILKNKNKFSKKEKARINKLVKWREGKENKYYFRQKIDMQIIESAWMTNVLIKLAKALNPYFKNITGRGTQKNPAIKHKTVQFISDFFNDLAGSKIFEPKVIRSRIKKAFEHK